MFQYLILNVSKATLLKLEFVAGGLAMLGLIQPGPVSDITGLPPWAIQTTFASLVGIVIYRLFWVEMPAFRKAIREMLESFQGERREEREDRKEERAVLIAAIGEQRKSFQVALDKMGEALDRERTAHQDNLRRVVERDGGS